LIELYVKSFDSVWFGVACENERVFATSFAGKEQKALADLLTCIPFGVGFQVSSMVSAFGQNVLSVLKLIYEGQDSGLKVALAMERLPPYTQKVLNVVLQIPVGYISTYGSVAKASGGGARAVGNVMAANPFAPLVPCHRVVSAGFGLGGYGGGLTVKHAFLVREKRGYMEQKEIPLNGRKLQVFPVEHVLKRFERK
jgi:methylated-DNA-[protein]-cysteine S-methyltransferase